MTTSTRPVIAVTGAHHWFKPGWWALNITLRCLGAKPLYLHSRNYQTLPRDHIQAIIISGGSDVEPVHFAADPLKHYRYDRERDQFEMHMIEAALKSQIPLLGICRGMQLLNVVLGGDLHVNICKQRYHTSNRPSAWPQKWANLQRPSLLHQRLGGDRDRVRINSLHKQAINNLGTGLNASAHDNDGFIQAIEHPIGWLAGVQWHPEYLAWSAPHRQLFRSLVNAARATNKTMPTARAID